MYHYYYDGSLEGLLSVIFDAYLNREKIAEVRPDPIQPSLNPQDARQYLRCEAFEEVASSQQRIDKSRR